MGRANPAGVRPAGCPESPPAPTPHSPTPVGPRSVRAILVAVAGRGVDVVACAALTGRHGRVVGVERGAVVRLRLAVVIGRAGSRRHGLSGWTEGGRVR